MLKLYPYKQGSASAKALAQALGIKRIRKEGKDITPDCWINWGSSVRPARINVGSNVINFPANVGWASNKLQAFEMMHAHRVNIPVFIFSHQLAKDVIDAGRTLVARTILNGHSGAGIHILDKNTEFVEAPLYTEYIKKKDEYRVHVHNGHVFFIQRKARKLDVLDDEVNWKVRNHANGFIYANQNVELPIEAKENACLAVRALGLDFGAVDIIHGMDGEFYVLEVNTAPGLTGTTLDKYVEQFQQYL
jgi:glutathione synthase/RimK-type ligase-like ATP-grasp enzyme